VPDPIDTDPRRLAARTLIERLRSTEYEDGQPPPDKPRWFRYYLDDEQAINAVLAFATLHRRTR
jgi:hypothetical protein